MKKGLIFLVISTICLSLCIFFIEPKEEIHTTDDKISIIATLFPQYDFAKQIGGDRADVALLLTPGTETHTYEPTPQNIIQINNADMFIYTGKYMEPWSDKIISSVDGNTKVLDVSKNINLRAIEHDHEPEEPEQHEYDPHIWLNPQNAVVMIKNITEELCLIDPNYAEYYNTNANKLITQIETLDSEIEEVVNSSSSKKIAFGGTFAYAYFIERYNLEYVSAYESCGEDTEPSVANIKRVVDYMNDNNIKVIFYQEMSSGKIADSIAKEVGGQKLVFHTVHNASPNEIDKGETYVSLMRRNLENIKIALHYEPK